MDVGTVLTAAFFRALLGSVLSGMLTGLITYQQNENAGAAVVAGAIAALSMLLVRGGIEGGIDANRARTGTVLSSDIGHSTISSVVTLPLNQPVNVLPTPVESPVTPP